MLLKFFIIIESNSQKTISAIVLYTNMAAVMSGANQELYHVELHMVAHRDKTLEEITKHCQ